ncbi:MAG: glycosyltransferase [Eubacteriales bacterium]|nr:glycosyltransferase [Eubacteriales bacterium]
MIVRTYNDWYTEHKKLLRQKLSEEDHSAGEKLTAEVVHYSHLKNHMLSEDETADIIIACDDDGETDELAEILIKDFFAAHPDINLLYGDEDRIAEDGVHLDPWFKTEWAPDTFLSTFYFGNIIAFRSAAFAMINPGRRKSFYYESASSLRNDTIEEERARRNEDDRPVRAWIYGTLCLKLAQADGGYTKRPTGRWRDFPVGHIPEVLYHGQHRVELWDGSMIKDSLTGRYSIVSAGTRLISIIIPSKDNPEMLARCVHSIEQHATVPHEIIIVDNGSNEANRAKVQTLVDEINEEGRCVYIYKESEFNMPAFYNLGAQYANGEMLLFIHDDIVVQKKGWLSHLSEKAKLPYVGAVGMKLLYPSSNIIQHAGINSVKDGIVYKLQYCRNDESYYFDFNKGVRNMLAMSGACMMVRKELFHEVGGFDEVNFPAFGGDIDFCCRIFERGYYNVVRNNMYLFYYETYSPENSRTKEERELRRPIEMNRLRELHKELAGHDPYYHPYLTQDMREPKFKINLEDVSVQPT